MRFEPLFGTFLIKTAFFLLKNRKLSFSKIRNFASCFLLAHFSLGKLSFFPYNFLFLSPSRNFCTPFASSSYSTFTLNELDNELEQKQAYEKLAKEVGLIRSGTLSGVKENILVVYPKIRWGKNSIPKNTTHELQLEEAVALVKTLPGFNVVK